MRDHRRMEVFQIADALALKICALTKVFPDDEKFGLASQLRRAAVSVGANIVEGAARSSQREFSRFLDMAYGSACELEYGLSIALRLGYLRRNDQQSAVPLANRLCKALRSFNRAVRDSASGQ